VTFTATRGDHERIRRPWHPWRGPTKRRRSDVQIVLKDGGRLARVSATGVETPLDPVKPWVFRVKAFSDVRYQFLLEGGSVKR